MTARKPLVLVGGEWKELPGGDTLAGLLHATGASNLAVVTQTAFDALDPPDPDTIYLIEGGGPRHVTLTQAEYDALDPPDPDTYYYIEVA